MLKNEAHPALVEKYNLLASTAYQVQFHKNIWGKLTDKKAKGLANKGKRFLK
jgi:hypothetical protein